ncbi:hypothetical protein [Streptomyces yangpuensis]|uniref:hypothetical protein n=1 Tax=Streptomyces yangpuensis TaxID=1648182 RepID=UPI0037182496
MEGVEGGGAGGGRRDGGARRRLGSERGAYGRERTRRDALGGVVEEGGGLRGQAVGGEDGGCPGGLEGPAGEAGDVDEGAGTGRRGRPAEAGLGQGDEAFPWSSTTR